MAVAYVQEFAIVNGDVSTTNYDAVVAALGLESAPDGLIVHSAGFDHEKGVFRIFDVWESREAADRWMGAVLNPALERVMGEAGPKTAAFAPPSADYWYDLHDAMS